MLLEITSSKMAISRFLDKPYFFLGREQVQGVLVWFRSTISFHFECLKGILYIKIFNHCHQIFIRNKCVKNQLIHLEPQIVQSRHLVCIDDGKSVTQLHESDEAANVTYHEDSFICRTSDKIYDWRPCMDDVSLHLDGLTINSTLWLSTN